MSNSPKRVLQILTAMNRGGAETMVMNHYRVLDRTKVQFDFLVHRQQRGDYDDEIEALGGRIFRAFPIRPWNYWSYFRWLDRFFSEHEGEFAAVHGHIQENTGFALRYAEKYGIANRLASSHIADLGIDYKYIFRQFGKLWTNRYATMRLACGKDAGKFLYGKRDFALLNNAIDTEKYSFNPEVRSQVRKEFNISSDTILVGNVARFCPQKNHEFIIRIFAELQRIHPTSKLILVGEGPLKYATLQLARKLGVDNNIIFAGLRPDVNCLLQGFDVFLMPSLFEGLPVSIIEAQAADLPCVLSDVIDRETDITGNISFISLKKQPYEWANAIINISDKTRKSRFLDIKCNGYDVETNILSLTKYYGID